MDTPETRYAKSGDVHIAYQVVGEGERDLVFVQGAVSHKDLEWEEPSFPKFWNNLASFSRLILFDKRGEVRGEDIGGIGVHIGQRVSALAGPSEVLVS